MDRASGSGVFARDPDALIDMVELDLTEDIVKQQKNHAACKLCENALKRSAPSALDDVSLDDLFSRNAMMKICCDHLPKDSYDALLKELQASDRYTEAMTAWRLEGTLREFPKFAPKNLYFRYPIHEEDKVGVLKDLQTDSELASWQRGAKKGHERQSANAKAKAADKNAELINTFNAVNVDGQVTVTEIAEYIGVSEKTIRRRLSASKDFIVENSTVKRAGTK